MRTDKLAVGGAQFIYGVVRRNGTNEYRVKLRLAVNGNVYVSASHGHQQRRDGDRQPRSRWPA